MRFGLNFSCYAVLFLVNSCHSFSITSRRVWIQASLTSTLIPDVTNAAEVLVPSDTEIYIVPPDRDVRQLVSQGRALESQGNMLAAERIYRKVTELAPTFVYGWSNAGNTYTALGDLDQAEASYTRAIDLCVKNARRLETSSQVRPCTDLYVLYLNRGSIRVNNKRAADAVQDLQQATLQRSRPDALISQNLARAYEYTQDFANAAREYNAAIRLTSNEVNPFWLRASLVQFQLGNLQDCLDLLKRVENRFPEAAEVQVAYAVVDWAKGNQEAAARRYLALPDRARLKYVDKDYVLETVKWPPAVVEKLGQLTKFAGDGALK